MLFDAPPIFHFNDLFTRPMKSKLLLLFACLSISAIGHAQTWATAISTNQSNGRAIVFRYTAEFAPNFDRASQPSRIILAWKYKSEKGMPSTSERERMDAMEDALSPVLENDGFATLALVSTGEDLREWTYYVRSTDEFLVRLNKALTGKTAFPIEIHTASDPTWSMYEKFKLGVKN